MNDIRNMTFYEFINIGSLLSFDFIILCFAPLVQHSPFILFNAEITKVEKPMAAILPSNGGGFKELEGIEEKLSHGFRR